jgi:hypothetical protein
MKAASRPKPESKHARTQNDFVVIQCYRNTAQRTLLCPSLLLLFLHLPSPELELGVLFAKVLREVRTQPVHLLLDRLHLTALLLILALRCVMLRCIALHRVASRCIA